MITVNGVNIPIAKFPAGEVNVKLPPLKFKSPMRIVVRATQSDDLVALLMITDAIRRHYPNPSIELVLPYLPYARQDRVTVHGEAVGASVFLRTFTTYSKLETYDVHNPAVLEDTYGLVNHITLLDIAKGLEGEAGGLSKGADIVLVAPDAGSSDKVAEVAEYFNVPWIQGEKVRCPETGHLSGFDVEFSKQHIGKKFLIVDDICDGGGTFIGLADIIDKKYEPESLSLYVTHGVFSQGLDTLSKTFSHIYTTNTYHAYYPDHDKLTVFEVVND